VQIFALRAKEIPPLLRSRLLWRVLLHQFADLPALRCRHDVDATRFRGRKPEISADNLPNRLDRKRRVSLRIERLGCGCDRNIGVLVKEFVEHSRHGDMRERRALGYRPRFHRRQSSADGSTQIGVLDQRQERERHLIAARREPRHGAIGVDRDLVSSSKAPGQ